MIHVQMPAEDPIHAAIARHRAAYDAFQVAPEGTPSVEANDEYDAASDALVSTACATRFGALALLTHLRWWLADEAEFKAGHQPAYGLAEARAADLTLFLGTPCRQPCGPTAMSWRPSCRRPGLLGASAGHGRPVIGAGMALLVPHRANRFPAKGRRRR